MSNTPHIESLFADGMRQYQAQQFLEAGLCFDQIIHAQPEHETAYFYLARCCEQLNKIDDAIDFYTKGSNINPEYAKTNMAEVHYFLGLSLGRLEQYQQAINSFWVANELGLKTSKLFRLLGDCYQHLHEFDAAVAAYEKALVDDQNNATLHSNFGHALRAVGEYEKAITHFTKALSINSHNADIHNNLAMVLMDKNQFTQALESIERALAIHPQHKKALLNKGLCLLILGDFQSGWPLYEYRSDAEPDQALSFKQQWREPQIEKILLEIEQGYGDILQMLRYIPLLKREKLTCYLQSPHELKSLIKRSFPLVNLVSTEEVVDVDARIRLCSLPFVFDTNADALIPTHIPYLKADDTQVADWEKLFLPYQKPLIGIVWRGRVRKTHMERSIPISLLRPLFLLNQFQFVVLQKDLTQQEVEELSHFSNVTILDKQLTDFDDTAAVMKNLKMMISICSSPVHLAGALGVNTLALLPFAADWRWMVGREDSPWYPTVQLIRQETANEWSGVIDKVITLLLTHPQLQI